MRRLVAATLLLYPRHVRHRHGAELESLVEELIEREGASRPAVMTRLAADGLAQRLMSRTTAWVVAITVTLTSLGGLAVSDFSAASAHRRPPAAALTRTAPGTAHTAAARHDARRGNNRAHRKAIIHR